MSRKLRRKELATYLQSTLRLFESRLSRYIATWVFLSIVAIEIVILVPSYFRREQELLGQLKQVSEEVLSSVNQLGTGLQPEAYLQLITQQLRPNSVIVGGVLYRPDGTRIGTFGEIPRLSYRDIVERRVLSFRSLSGDRYDYSWQLTAQQGTYILIIRHNSANIQTELYAFTARIAGLVLIIASFVTLTTMLTLGYTVITPILRLRDDLLLAGEAISQDVGTPNFQTFEIHRRDELGEVMSAFNQMFCRIQQEIRDRTQAEKMLRDEQQKSERLLQNILPEAIAAQLKESPSIVANRSDAVTILFADIVDFTQLSARISATELVGLLNQIFSAFDQLAEQFGLEKIKTIGDAYMVVGGVPTSREDHAEAIANMALAMQQSVRQFRTDLGEPFQLRIGINTGAVVSGVIGIKKFSYDLWGDAVNIASRMESQGQAGKIQVTESTYQHLHHAYRFEQRGTVQVKGRGPMVTYWLLDKLHHGIIVQ